jgi:hypothetical protein
MAAVSSSLGGAAGLSKKAETELERRERGEGRRDRGEGWKMTQRREKTERGVSRAKRVDVWMSAWLVGVAAAAG